MHKIVNGERVPLTDEEIAEFKQREEEHAAQEIENRKTEYRHLRAAAYPDINSQLDMIYWDKVNGTDLWKEEITRIKGLFPKPLTRE